MTKNKTPTLDDLLQKIKHGDSKQYYSSEWGKQAILQWVADDVVGKDDWHGDRVNGYQRNTVDTVRNKHRDEQRQILKDHGWKG